MIYYSLQIIIRFYTINLLISTSFSIHPLAIEQGDFSQINVKKSSLGLDSDDLISVVNLKCEPALIGSFIKDDGIFPAYHMNKEHWLSVALDGSVPEDRIKLLVDISFELTALKVVKNMRKKS